MQSSLIITGINNKGAVGVLVAMATPYSLQQASEPLGVPADMLIVVWA